MESSHKILHIIGGGEIGGAEQHVLSLLKGLDHLRFIPHLVCLNKGPFSELATQNNITTTTLPMKFPLDLSPIPELIRWARKQNISLIHTHGSRANLIGRLSAKWLGIPNLSTVHSSLAHDYLSPWAAKMALTLDRLTLPLTSGIIAVSESLAKEAASRGGKNIETIYNGRSPLPFDNPSVSRALFRQQWGIPSDALVLGTIGRLHPTKGQLYLIRAASQLQTDYPNLHLLLIGEGPLRESLTYELQKSGIPHTITGFLPSAYKALPAMDLFVLPSISEGMGLVLLEALQAQIPTVASDVGGIPELIRNGQDGLLVPPKDSVRLKTACATILKDPSFAQSLREEGRKRWPLFSLELMIKKTEAMYTRILTQAKYP